MMRGCVGKLWGAASGSVRRGLCSGVQMLPIGRRAAGIVASLTHPELQMSYDEAFELLTSPVSSCSPNCSLPHPALPPAHLPGAPC